MRGVEERGRAFNERLQQIGNVAPAEQLERGLVEGSEELGLTPHRLLGAPPIRYINDRAIPDDAAIVQSPRLGPEADPAFNAARASDARLEIEGRELAP